MANPQLTSYIKQQLGLGDNESSIKNNLRSVGWGESDIADAFNEASPTPPSVSAAQPVQPVAAAKPATPATPSFTPPTTQPASPNLNPAPTTPRKINLDSFAPMSSPSPMSRPFAASPAVVSFTAQKPMESIFQPKSAVPSIPAVPGMNSNPSISPLVGMSPVSSTTAAKKSWGSIITMVILGLIVLGLGWFSWTLYQSNSALTAQMSALNSQLSVASGQSAASQSLSTQVAALQSDKADLESQFVLFLPASASSTASTTVTLKGVIGGGGKLNYMLTTDKIDGVGGVIVNVKNSKDPKIVAVLGPLVGSSATLIGIPTVGAREITVMEVNGIVPVLPAPAPTSTASTTVTPAPPAPNASTTTP